MVGSQIRWDVSYLAGGTEKQRLDIYSPPAASGAPILVFVHGGEWAKGDKSEVSFKPKYLNEQGIVFISMNYRLSGTDRHPAQVNDIAAAVKWIRRHAPEFGGDPAMIVLMGHSAGCHLVTLTGLDPRPFATVGLKPADLKGIISWSGGAFDLVEKVRGGGMYATYITLNFGDDPLAWRDASPISHIGDARPFPAFLFASAADGNPASRELSDKMASLIRDKGGDARSLLLAGKTHQAANHEVGMKDDDTGPELLRFIREVTGK
jgi:acetyl esterase/lipase